MATVISYSIIHLYIYLIVTPRNLDNLSTSNYFNITKTICLFRILKLRNNLIDFKIISLYITRVANKRTGLMVNNYHSLPCWQYRGHCNRILYITTAIKTPSLLVLTAVVIIYPHELKLLTYRNIRLQIYILLKVGVLSYIYFLINVNINK